jgi:hypothetical protein
MLESDGCSELFGDNLTSASSGGAYRFRDSAKQFVLLPQRHLHEDSLRRLAIKRNLPPLFSLDTRPFS